MNDEPKTQQAKDWEAGKITLNQARGQLGLPPYDFPAADTLWTEFNPETWAS